MPNKELSGDLGTMEWDTLVQVASAMSDEEQQLMVSQFKLENVLAALSSMVLAQRDHLDEIIKAVNTK